MKEILAVGDRVSLLGSTNWGEVVAVKGRQYFVKWDRVGLLARTRKTWEGRTVLSHIPPE